MCYHLRKNYTSCYNLPSSVWFTSMTRLVTKKIPSFNPFECHAGPWAADLSPFWLNHIQYIILCQTLHGTCKYKHTQHTHTTHTHTYIQLQDLATWTPCINGVSQQKVTRPVAPSAVKTPASWLFFCIEVWVCGRGEGEDEKVDEWQG